MTAEPIEFKAHSPQWASAFYRQATRLKAKFGENLTAVHHVGSTAIPGIQAKPVIDIAVESPVYPPSDFIVHSLSELGFTSHGSDGVPGRHWFSKGAPRTFNLHWCPVNGTVVQSQIRFRDTLRANKNLTRTYEQLKKAAAYGNHIDSSQYASAKSNFIKMVLSA